MSFRSTRRQIGALAWLGLLLATGGSAGAESAFTGLGIIRGESQYPSLKSGSYGIDVSADGTVVAGTNNIPSPPGASGGYDAFVWTEEQGIELLGELLAGGRSLVSAISADGSTIVGSSWSARPHFSDEAFLWTSQDAMIGLGGLGPDATSSNATDVSADGSIVVGYSYGPNGLEPFRWTREGGMVGLGHLSASAGDRTLALGIAADGATIVGESHYGSGSNTEAFRWNEDEGMVGLGFLPGEDSSTASVVSPDGSMILGVSKGPHSGGQAFLWTAGQGMVGLGDLPGGFARSSPGGISADGRTIVGRSATAEFDVRGFTYDRAFIWDPEHGMRALHDVLEDDGVDLTGWTLISATAVSEDGRVVVGFGTNPTDELEGFIAFLDRPIHVEIDVRPGSPVARIDPMSRGVVPVALLGSDTFDVRDVDLATLAFGPAGASAVFGRGHPVARWLPARDLDRDGFADLLSIYAIPDTGIAIGDDEACLTGVTIDGTPFEGCDSIETRPMCGRGFELAALVPGLVWLGGRRRRSD